MIGKWPYTMQARFWTVCNLQIVTANKQERTTKPQLLLKQDSKDLNQIGVVLPSGEHKFTAGQAYPFWDRYINSPQKATPQKHWPSAFGRRW